jgi:beta-N-acetylhexosaminidase
MPPRWRRVVTIGFVLLELGLAVAAPGLASDWRSPFFADYRALALAALIAGPLILVAVEIGLLRRAQLRWLRLARLAIAALAATAVAFTLALEARFWWVRAQVLDAEPERLARLGRHFIVGYRDPLEVDALLRRRAIAGIFMGARNVGGQSAAAIASQVAAWQDIRRNQGLPPLWIATDQEGGAVSRLSPPLPRQPSIAVLAQEDAGARPGASYAYGFAQGRALASLGVNLNFAPVVDLDFGVINPNDRYTRIYQRAISRDPNIVAEIAGRYCDGLAAASVRCTLKHFPGLGRVRDDTHIGSAELPTPVAELASSDWIPFRTLMASASFVMMSHVRLVDVDAARPASFSQAVVAGLVRESFGYDGVLVTDDFGMRAVYGSGPGLAEASVQALNAGVDLVLIAYDPDQYFPAMNALLRADREGRLAGSSLGASERRLDLAGARQQGGSARR